MTRFNQHMQTNSARAKTAVAFVDRHMTTLNVAGLVLVAIVAVLYIVQVNRTVTHGYAIRELESEIHELTLDNQQLEVDARAAQSLDRVTRSVKMLGLVEAGTPRYLTSGEPSYAMAK